MIRKPPRPEADIENLAKELQSRMREGESIEAWMRRNIATLTRLVRIQGWRWEDVGTAMTRAGITYSTGRPWTPEVLRVKASEARAQIRARRERSREPVLKTPVMRVRERPGAMIGAGDQAPSVPIQQSEPEQPKFALARIVSRHEAPQKAAPEPAEGPASAPASKHDAEAVRRRFFGTTDPSKE